MPNSRFSAVQLTLLSIIVALILESLLNQLDNNSINWATLLPWLQAGLVAITVIAIWSGFALILSTSDRKPETVDFVYPFGLLITLSLATDSLGENRLASFFGFLAFGSLFACWALHSEWRSERRNNGGNGVRHALYIQSADTALNSLMALVLLVSVPPLAVVTFALIIAIMVQAVAAIGTMRGWRFVSRDPSED